MGCPTQRQKDIVSHAIQNHNQFCVQVELHVTNIPLYLSVLIDYWSAGYFVSSSFVSALSLPVIRFVSPISVNLYHQTPANSNVTLTAH